VNRDRPGFAGEPWKCHPEHHDVIEPRRKNAPRSAQRRQRPQRGVAATKHVGPNGRRRTKAALATVRVRPRGERRSPSRDGSKSSQDNNVPQASATARQSRNQTKSSPQRTQRAQTKMLLFSSVNSVASVVRLFFAAHEEVDRLCYRDQKGHRENHCFFTAGLGLSALRNKLVPVAC
jgi:hypothetical protein